MHPVPAPPPPAPPAPWLQEHPGHPAEIHGFHLALQHVALQVEPLAAVCPTHPRTGFFQGLGLPNAANSAGPILIKGVSGHWSVQGAFVVHKPFLISGYSWQLLSS